MFHVEHFDLVFFAKSYDYGLYDCIRSSSWNSFSKGRCPFDYTKMFHVIRNA